MAPVREAVRVTHAAVESRPAPYARSGAIGTDNPARADIFHPRDGRAPAQLHARLLSRLDQLLVETNAAYSDAAGAAWKIRLDGTARAMETDAAKLESKRIGKMDADAGRGAPGVGQQPFATGFVDGWAIAVSHHHAPAFAPRGDGYRQPRRTATDDEYIRIGHSRSLPEYQVGTVLNHAQKVQRHLARVIIAPHASFAARHAIRIRRRVPTVGPVIDRVQDQALMVGVRTQVGLVEERVAYREARGPVSIVPEIAAKP
jgi:hypothetical protein